MADQPPSWSVAALSSAPQLRHQTSLEEIIDMSSAAQEPLREAERAAALNTFNRIVQHFEREDTYDATPRPARHKLYSIPRLVRYTYEHALSAASRDIFLRAFCGSLGLDLGANESLDLPVLAPLFSAFAEYLMDNFFLPLKASTRKTPQPSPAIHSAVLRAQGAVGNAEAYVGTEERLSTLRAECLVRDRYRCVISRKFSEGEFVTRSELYGDEARDDDGVLLSNQDPPDLDILEVAHILPHSLTKARTNGALDKSRQAALSILNMFDHGVVNLIDGIDIDRPRNALTLTHRMHNHFGAFNVYFEPVDGQYNTYRIGSFLHAALNRDLGLPVTRTLYVTEDRTIDSPLPRLLAIHCAIAHIMHLSGAAEYIEWILRDMDEYAVRADGSSALGRMVSLGLGGWLDSAVCS